MTVDQLVKNAHNTATEKGWWLYDRRPLELHALFHSEIAEATEAVRVGNVEVEQEDLADTIIRIADYFGQMGWDLTSVIERKMQFNKTRSYRHGGKLA